jgi:hypothetical protein
MVHTQFKTIIKIVHSGNEGEYMSSELGLYFRE